MPPKPYDDDRSPNAASQFFWGLERDGEDWLWEGAILRTLEDNLDNFFTGKDGTAVAPKPNEDESFPNGTSQLLEDGSSEAEEDEEDCIFCVYSDAGDV